MTLHAGQLSRDGTAVSVPITYPGGITTTLTLTLADDDTVRASASGGWVSPFHPSPSTYALEVSPTSRPIDWPLPIGVPIAATIRYRSTPDQSHAAPATVGFRGDRTVVVADDDAGYVIDVPSGHVVNRFGYGAGGHASSAVLSPSGRRLVALDYTGVTAWTVCDTESGRTLSAHHDGHNRVHGTENAVFSDDDRQLFVDAGEGLRAFDGDGVRETARAERHARSPRLLGVFNGLLVSGKEVGSDDPDASESGRCTVLRDPSSLEVRNRIRQGMPAWDVLSADGRLALTIGPEQLVVSDRWGRRPTVVIRSNPDYYFEVASERYPLRGDSVFLPGGRWVAVANGRALMIADAANGQWVFREQSLSTCNHPVVSPDGRLMAVLTGGDVTLLNVADLMAVIAARQAAETAAAAAAAR